MKKKKKDMEIILASMTEEEKNSYIFSQKIKLLLHRRCMTQAELAQKIGITQTALSHYINCKRTPSYKTVTKIAETLDTPITYLLNKDCANEEDAAVLEGEDTFDKDFDAILSLIAKHKKKMLKEQKMEIISALVEGRNGKRRKRRAAQQSV